MGPAYPPGAPAGYVVAMSINGFLILTAALAAETRFHPGPGPECVTIDADSRIGSMPVRRTGALLAHVEDPGALLVDPDVARVEVLAGDGHVVRIVPREGLDEGTLSVDLHGRPGVTWAHPDLALPLVLHALPDDPFVTDQWHLENTGQGGWLPGVDINAEAAWARTSGHGALVAIVDTGVELTHPDLAVIGGWDYVSGDADSSPDLEDDSGPHGTASAGLAAAIGDNGRGVAGVAWEAQVYAIRLIGGYTTLGDLYDAFVEATDAGAWVISNSWGFGDDCSPFPTFGSIQDAVDYAEQHGRGGLGTVVVASAGNANCDISEDGFLAHPAVVGVAASNGNDEREGYSCYGDHVDLSAPSGGVLTTDLTGEAGYGSWEKDDACYGYFSGTSASAPIVAGAVALLFGANPRLTAAQAREVLCETAVRLDVDHAGYDASGWSPWYGCGRVDAGSAVQAVANAAPGAPVPLVPGAEAWEERVLLAWVPAVDPDGDWLEHTVSWWVDEGPVQEATLEGSSLDLSGAVQAGDRVSWQVSATDLWGPGEASDVRSFRVVETPRRMRPDASCAATGRRHGAWAILLALLAMARRRRG
ncbi:MAG: S8 family serine peptidase [Deltaproteobacteria bacterium]|nr:S8 family serine peptidase [Deltaproteobacteria bacterium]